MSEPALIKTDKEPDFVPQNNHPILKEPAGSHVLHVGTNQTVTPQEVSKRYLLL